MWGRTARKQPDAAAMARLWAVEELRPAPVGQRSSVAAAIPQARTEDHLVAMAALPVFSLPPARWEPAPRIQEIPEVGRPEAVQPMAMGVEPSLPAAARDCPVR